MTSPRTASVKEAALALGLSTATVYKAIERNEIPALRIGGRVLVLRSPLERMLRGDAQRPAQEALRGR